MRFIGQKQKKFYNEFVSKFIPVNIETYVEPFGGSFAVVKHILEDDIDTAPVRIVYNDINQYDIDIYADEIHHLDYKEIFRMYDSVDTVFYLDPPYVGKEFYYDGCENFNHEELRDEIKKLKGKVILSYADHRLVRELYKDFNINKYDGENIIFREELIIINY